MNKVAVMLSGCGTNDGSDMHETVLLHYFLHLNQIDLDFFSPDISTPYVVNHINGQLHDANRNTLEESARLARGNILSVEYFDHEMYEAVFFPGGLGLTQFFSTYHENASNFEVNESIQSVITASYASQTPLAFIGQSSIIAAKLIPNCRLTLGFSNEAQETISNLGGIGIQANYDDVVVDGTHLVASTPGMMLGSSVSEVSLGIQKLVTTVINLTK